MKNLLFFLVVLASFASCKKEDSSNSLPEPSSSGKNFLACKVNGVVHQYSGLRDWMTRVGVDYTRFVDEIVLSTGSAGDAIGIYVKLPPDSITAGVTYTFGSEAGSHYGVYAIKGVAMQPSLQYRTSVNSGWVRFSRVDTSVAAGTFSFNGYVETPSGIDSVFVSEGVFDIVSY